MEIEEIHVQSKLIKVQYNENTKVLTITSDLDPTLIDENFNELDERLKKVEKQMLNMKINNIKNNLIR